MDNSPAESVGILPGPADVTTAAFEDMLLASICGVSSSDSESEMICVGTKECSVRGRGAGGISLGVCATVEVGAGVVRDDGVGTGIESVAGERGVDS